MFENSYSTKMSADKKKLQKRFKNIREGTKNKSLIISVVAFAIVAVAIIFAAVIFSQNSSGPDYIMNDSELIEYRNNIVGAIMAEFDYIDDQKLVFHYLDGLFVKDRKTGGLTHRINLHKLNVAPHQQGSNALEIKIDNKGKYAYLSSIGPDEEIKDFDSYILDLLTGEVKKGAMPENTVLFEGYTDTYETYPEAFGWHSDTCIMLEETGYYLTVRDANIGALELVSVSPAGEIKTEYVFGDYAAGFEQSRVDMIQEFLPEGEILDTEKRYSYEMNTDKLLKLYNIVGFSGVHNVDAGGNFDVRIYSVKKTDAESHYLFVIDNYKQKVVSCTDIGNGKLLEELLYFLEDKSEDLYLRTKEFLESEFHRVFDPYYDITSLEISNWNSNGQEATLFYKMKYIYYNRDPDKAEYIKKAKESGNPNYKKMYDEYLEEKKCNFEFCVRISPKGELLLYSNVSPVGEPEWERTEIDDYILK